MIDYYGKTVEYGDLLCEAIEARDILMIKLLISKKFNGWKNSLWQAITTKSKELIDLFLDEETFSENDYRGDLKYFIKDHLRDEELRNYVTNRIKFN